MECYFKSFTVFLLNNIKEYMYIDVDWCVSVKFTYKVIKMFLWRQNWSIHENVCSESYFWFKSGKQRKKKETRLKNMYIGKLHIDDDDRTDIICITIYSLMHDLLAYKYKKIRFILTENMKDDLTWCCLAHTIRCCTDIDTTFMSIHIFHR